MPYALCLSLLSCLSGLTYLIRSSNFVSHLGDGNGLWSKGPFEKMIYDAISRRRFTDREDKELSVSVLWLHPSIQSSHCAATRPEA